MYPPTDRQLEFLKKLGYSGEPPISKQEASFLIDGRKAGKKAEALEKAMLKARSKAEASWFKDQRHYAKMEIQQARDSDGVIAGFIIRIGRTCDGAKRYHGAFLPTHVAMKNPKLLPPYEGICQYGKCECEYEEMLKDEKISMDTPMILGPNKITTIGKHRRSRHGCARTLLLLAFIAFIVYLVVRYMGS